MSRRRRGRSAPESVPAEVAATAPVGGASVPAEQPARRRPQAPAYVFSRPVIVDGNKADIDDMVLLAEISTLGQGRTEQEMMVEIYKRAPQIRDLMNRVVRGGTKGRPAQEFMPLLQEVVIQFGRLGTGTQGN